jgi:hypothetical protein
MMPSYANQTITSSNACPHCGGADLFTEPRPPHVALVCRNCSRWIKWVRQSRILVAESQPFQETLKVIKPSFDARAEVERLAKIVEGHDRQLLLFTKIILDLGTLQGKQRPEIHIADELVNDLSTKLYELESRNGDRPASDSY